MIALTPPLILPVVLILSISPKKSKAAAKNNVDVCNFYSKIDASRQSHASKYCSSVNIEGQNVKKQKTLFNHVSF